MSTASTLSDERLPVLYTKRAQADIEAIFEFIALESSLAIADRMIDAITSTCSDLGAFPQMGRRRSELSDLSLEVRSIGERGYVIFYTERHRQIFVLRILHGARDVSPGLFTTDDDQS